MTTHVFIVNEDTFSAHLKYMFVGTSSKKKDSNISLLADIKRVRTDDKVVFYHERVGFYGIFKIKENINIKGKHIIYYDKDNYCDDMLRKKLLYRVLIEPDEVYSNPVSEWEALEKLPENPRDIIWSLIYRKLKGGRGCTPVTPKESDKLLNLIRKSNTVPIDNSQNLFWEDGKIINRKNKLVTYDISNAKEIDIEEIIYAKRDYETYLQAYFTENAGNPQFDGSVFADICGNSTEMLWLGNEFYCGVGMQKIDVFTMTNHKNKQFRLIELKTKEDTGVYLQLERYVKWAREYISETNKENLIPIVVIPHIPNQIYVNELKNKILPFFNNTFQLLCQSVKLYEFYFDDKKRINFQKIKY